MVDTVFLLERLKARDHLEDPSIDGTVILTESARSRAGVHGLRSGSGLL
jgi:hypothetical protein